MVPHSLSIRKSFRIFTFYAEAMPPPTLRRCRHGGTGEAICRPRIRRSRGRASGRAQSVRRLAKFTEPGPIARTPLGGYRGRTRGYGVVGSRCGGQGGCRLIRDSADVSAAHVIRVAKDPVALTPSVRRHAAWSVAMASHRLLPWLPAWDYDHDR